LQNTLQNSAFTTPKKVAALTSPQAFASCQKQNERASYLVSEVLPWHSLNSNQFWR
jgi:hypothetical protein